MLLLLQAIIEDLCGPDELKVYLEEIIRGGYDVHKGLIKNFPELVERDVTSSALTENKRAVHVIISKEMGVVSGLREAVEIFKIVDPKVKFTPFKEDGEVVKSGDEVAKIEGDLWSLLVGERAALNFLCHLSGIATRTREFVTAVEGTTAKILDTRKTLPGFRVLAKQAVVDGGGMNHRMGLWDMVLIKNNHVDTMGGIDGAVRAVRDKWDDKFKIEVEVRNLDEVRQAVETKVDRIMLDNMDLEEMEEAVEVVAGACEVEASGNVSLDGVKAIAETGVDFISIGGDLTMSAPRIDFSVQHQEILE
jgi:nicotinate-nucleotide pyrophosphorylase (carboxylating)